MTYHKTALQVEYVDMTSLRPYIANARAHPRRQIQRIAKSIEQFGFANPILIDKTGEIIAGHGRFEAAQQLGLNTVPVIRLSHLTDAQKRALRIADNRIAEQSSWTPELLSSELQFLIDDDFEVELTGFDAIDLDRLLSPEACQQDPDDTPVPSPPAAPLTRLGDIWLLGGHRVICGDAQQAETYSALLGGERADLVITDPPYNVPIPGHVSGTARHRNFAMASGEMSEAEFQAFVSRVLTRARDHSRLGSLHYVFMDWRGLGTLLKVGSDLYQQQLNLCVWAKTNAGMGSFYRSPHELVAVYRHGDISHINNVQLGRLGRHRSNLWTYAGATTFSPTRKADLIDHPTVKPVALLADAIRDASKPGDLVLDPFGGSGSTLLAAQHTGRRSALIEIDPAYVDVILRRFEERTGIAPVLAANGATIAEIRNERKETVDV
jgi:DNA modification methylase